jgi:hypothetical protein
VTINLLDINDNSSKTLIKNAIRKYKTNYTWFDVFDEFENLQLPKEIYENFEKHARIVVSSKSTACETFDADPYDSISVLTDFDPTLKFVTINVKEIDHSTINEEGSESEAGKNVFQVMMAASFQRRKPPTIKDTAPKFTGLNNYCYHILEYLRKELLLKYKAK